MKGFISPFPVLNLLQPRGSLTFTKALIKGIACSLEAVALGPPRVEEIRGKLGGRSVDRVFESLYDESQKEKVSSGVRRGCSIRYTNTYQGRLRLNEVSEI